MQNDLIKNILINKKTNIINDFNSLNYKIKKILDEIYNPYILFPKNNINKNNALHSLLDNYQYYNPRENVIVPGDYIRYININGIGNNIYLKKGGFLIEENDSFIYISNNKHNFKISKKENYIFRKLTKNDIFRISISKSFS